MNQSLIFLPMFILVTLTYIVAITMVRGRFSAVKNQQVDSDYYRVFVGDTEPDSLRQVSRHYANLFELPILFYAACIVAYVSSSVDWVMLLLSVVFVIARILHAYVHITSNRLLFRMRIFGLGFATLGAIWVYLCVSIFTQ